MATGRWMTATEKREYGADYVVNMTYSDVAALGAATDGAAIAILPLSGTFPAGTTVQCVGMKLVTKFNCTGTGNLTVSLGYGGAETAFLAATQIAKDQTAVLYAAGTGTRTAFVAADTIDAFYDSTGVNLSTYTSGEVAFYLRVDNLQDLPKA